ncbi:MAG: arginine--tRNA ligase [Bacteriovoracaceae bacterium]
MFLQHDPLKNLATKSIQPLLSRLGVEWSDADIYSALGPTPNRDLGHMAFACFKLSKDLKKSPAQVSTELAGFVGDLPSGVAQIKAAGPYLNLFFDTGAVAKNMLPTILTGELFTTKITNNTPKTMVEYSQPNTHKEMHVGHMRNLCLGAAVIEMMKYAGFEIISSTFPGDVGTHVAKCLWYMKKHNTENPPASRKGAWLGQMYSRAHNLLEDQKGSEMEDKNRAELTEILKQLEKKQGEYFDLWIETRQWSIDLMNDVYQWAGVKFDQWYWESEVDSASLKLVDEYFKKGLFIKDEGAIGCDLSEDKLGFCLLVKSDGNGLYATKDIELARRKFQDHKIQKSIYVVDKRQAHHFAQVFKVLEKMGFKEAKDCFHLQYDFVELPDGPMSSRKGNIIPIQALIDQMKEMIKTEYLARYIGQWSEKEIEETAHIVSVGAIKFGMTRVDTTKKIVFDMKEWLKLDGESGPYIQYVYARIQSLLEKQGRIEKNFGALSALSHPLESQLVQKLLEFNSVVENAVTHYKTIPVTGYLYDVAKMFNSFYAELSVANAETPELKVARLGLCEATGIILKKGLSILGVQSPDKM